MSRSHCAFAASLFLAVFSYFAAPRAEAGTPIVPGTGEFMPDCCDDFEAIEWTWKYNLPKSSEEQDKKVRGPGGMSNNRLWHEGAKRGTPDIVKRVPTPPGGIEGSTGSLLFATKYSGIPGSISNEQQQDDLLMMFNKRLGRSIPVAWQPSVTVRVYLPPFEQWENRTGPSFGMRCDCRGINPDGSVEEYWPGMFLLFRSETSRNIKEDYAQLSVRSGPRGNDIHLTKITEPGWWTMGMSFSPDGQIHYYAKPGVEDLTADDFLMSQYPYRMKCQTLNNFFFNVANWDNGRTWSTQWVIDDPKVYVIPPSGQTVANLHRIKPKPKVARQPNRTQTTTNQPVRTQKSASTSRRQQSR